MSYSGNVTSTTTVPPSGTAPRTVIVQVPASYVTTTAGYTGTVKTTTTVSPSGTRPGTVIVQTPLATLNCDPSGYLIQSKSLYRVNITNENTTLVKIGLGDGTRTINAMGYNIADNFLYAAIGTAPTTNLNLIRISADGTSNILGSLNVTYAVNSGDVDGNSQYWATAGGSQWLQVDLMPGSSTYGMTLANGDALYALAYAPQYTATILVRFDRTTHVWTQLTNFGNIAGENAWGAVYASDDGFLYGSREHQRPDLAVPPSGKRHDPRTVLHETRSE
ncbi:Uu.00g124000.m01.CDS01 [Anthostomella pinea]|uniref:Uu.00g124000.m01.CDS01 n=1 Tax=Anthostomella pinea TaxID=933095 RepID=A0AAI8VI65_9PEZI|nr:Uu.00g124000.m01.CDS01 [Anthostomella pinea]